jgi:hypothetical protein
MKRIDAAMARHLDIVHYYNTLLKVVEDEKRHIIALNEVLGELRGMMGAENNRELIEAVKALLRENADGRF